MNPTAPLPLQTLLRIVHHRRPSDEPRIALVLRLTEVSLVVRQRLENLLTRLGLSDRGFAALVALYTFDPEPVTPADLAYHVDAPRSTVATTLEHLIHSGHIARQHDARHRGATRLHLTAAGRELVAQAVKLLLDAADRISTHLPAETCTAISALCDALQAECRAADTTVLSHESPFVP